MAMKMTRFEHAMSRRTVDLNDLRVDVPQARLSCRYLNQRLAFRCVIEVFFRLSGKHANIWQLVRVDLDLAILLYLALC